MSRAPPDVARARARSLASQGAGWCCPEAMGVAIDRTTRPPQLYGQTELPLERDAARAERDSLLIERDALRSERDTLRGQLSATTGFKDQLLAALLKQRPASSPPSVTASVAISNNTIEMSPTVSNNQTSNQTKPGKNGVRGAQ